MNKRTLRVIKEIHASVPQDLRDRLFVETYIAPDLRLEARKQAKELFEEANALPDGPKKETALKGAQRLQNIIDAGYYDAKEKRVDPEVAKQIEAYIDTELDKAIKEGRIPHPKDDTGYQNYQRKLRKHEHKSRREAFTKGTEAQPDDQAGGGTAD
jgi:hypothetical protein